MANTASTVLSMMRKPSFRLRIRHELGLPVVLVALLATVPLFASLIGQDYYITFASRVLVLAIAAMGLNVALGYAGMVSFGHALYVGLGAYAVAVLTEIGIQSAFAQIAISIMVGCSIATVVGAVCLRASGIGFIMITLAFSQMFYFVIVSLKKYGGDDGMQIAERSTFFGVSPESPFFFYYLVLCTLACLMMFIAMMAGARFGWVIRGSKLNARRMAALGYPIFRYRLSAYVISAAICILAGFLLANLTRFASPSYVHGSLSGELLVMVVLGGMGTVAGPVLGAICLLVIEELLANFSLGLPLGSDSFVRSHFMLLIGLFVILVGVAAKHGLVGLLDRRGLR